MKTEIKKEGTDPIPDGIDLRYLVVDTKIPDIKVLFQGVCDNAPGDSTKDVKVVDKLHNVIAGQWPDRTFYAFVTNSDHKGIFHTIDDTTESKDTFMSDGGFRFLGTRWSHTKDGVIIRPSNDTNDASIQVAGARARDCFVLCGYLPDGTIFAIHASNKNLFSTHTTPILSELFKELKAEDSHVILNPAIGGTQSRCQCYGYTETSDRPDGSNLKKSVIAACPGIEENPEWKKQHGDIFQIKPGIGKMLVRWGTLMIVLLGYYRVPREQIDDRYNFYTCCDPNLHSLRKITSGIMEPPDPKDDIRVSNLALIARGV